MTLNELRAELVRRIDLEREPMTDPSGATPRTREALAAAVWALLDADPEFNRAMREAEAELEAGGGVPFRHRWPPGTIHVTPRERYVPSPKTLGDSDAAIERLADVDGSPHP